MEEERKEFVELGFDEDIIYQMSDYEIEKMCWYKDADDMEKFYEKMVEKFEKKRGEEND